MIIKFPILVFTSSFTSFTLYSSNWSWGWKFTVLLQSSNLNIKRLAFSPKFSALKISLFPAFEQKNIFPRFKEAHLSMPTRKLVRYLFGGRNKPISELCVHFNQWRYFYSLGKRKAWSYVRRFLFNFSGQEGEERWQLQYSEP